MSTIDIERDTLQRAVRDVRVTLHHLHAEIVTSASVTLRDAGALEVILRRACADCHVRSYDVCREHRATGCALFLALGCGHITMQTFSAGQAFLDVVLFADDVSAFEIAEKITRALSPCQYRSDEITRVCYPHER